MNFLIPKKKRIKKNKLQFSSLHILSKNRLLNTNEGMVCSVWVCVKVYQSPAAVIPNNRIEPMGSDLVVDPDGCWHKGLTKSCCADPERINLWLTMPLIPTSTS